MKNARYFILRSSVDCVENGMMLYGMPDLPDDLHNDWFFGKPFTEEPEQPIPVTIQAGSEDSVPISFYYEISVARNDFVDALLDAGVDNIAVYDAVLETEDEEVRYSNYKAINILGLVSGLKSEQHPVTDSGTDSCIRELDLEHGPTHGMLMFRLAEDLGTIIVHERVKEQLEAKGFVDLVFTEASSILML